MRTFLMLTFILAACRGGSDAAPTAAPAAKGLPPATGAAAAAPAGNPHAGMGGSHGSAGAGDPSGTVLSGTVLEAIDAPPYTYLRLKTGAGEEWAAVSQVAVKAGDTVAVQNAMLMEAFESKTLKRKFDKIYFGTVAEPTGGAAPAAAAAPAAGKEPAGSGHTTVAAAPDTKTDKATGPGAATVAEVYAQKATLKDQEVAVRGKVVKYNGGIMGKNWLHVQDGSGSEAKGDHDITVTTADEAKVGDVVTVRGKVHLDRDFGAGYAYPVIVEDAKLTR